MAKKAKPKLDGVSPDISRFDFIPQYAREQLHIRELQAEVEKARITLKRKDRIDAAYFLLQCQNEARRSLDVQRIAPMEVAGDGSFSKQHLRLAFLRTISKEVPAVWEELRDGPYLLYSEIADIDIQLGEVESILAYKKLLPEQSSFEDEYHRLMENPDALKGRRLCTRLLGFLLNLRREDLAKHGFDSKPPLIPEDSNWFLTWYPDLTPEDFGIKFEGSRKDNVRRWQALKNARQAHAEELIPLRDSLLEWAKNRNIAVDWVLNHVLHAMHLWRTRGIRPKQAHCEAGLGFDKKSLVNECKAECEGRCKQLLDSFDLSLASYDGPSTALPGGIAAPVAREDYLVFIEKKAREHLASSPILSIAKKEAREIFIKAILKEAADTHRRTTGRIRNDPSWKKPYSPSQITDILKAAALSQTGTLTRTEAIEHLTSSHHKLTGGRDAMDKKVQRFLAYIGLSNDPGRPNKTGRRKKLR